ncbi:Eisosome component PIL1 [Ceratobasidium theobromae]|uniref:Eisosome component PIL1 n=1 Tax=Ceratobasidium theobromae TaxID=1582974 RepID=A0A5N5QH77_9AGAM|nr:Eisosome component PIL1 [Ceratobasidium theobromae]
MVGTGRSSLIFSRSFSVLTSDRDPSLRALQELSGVEKRTSSVVQGLATELDRSVEWLRNWGVGEGEDLGDVLFHSTNLFIQLSGALMQYASYGEQIRTHFKSIRTRERLLSKMRKRRTRVDDKADTVERKLTKMAPDPAGHAAQAQLLRELKEEGQRLGVEIVTEEAAIGDYKRRATKEFMGLKFDGISELAEKLTVIGEMGKLIIDETPLETTPPGHPRAPYIGRERTAVLSSQAMGRLGASRGQPNTVPQPHGQLNTSHPSSPISQSRPSFFIVQSPDGYGDTQFGRAQFGPGPSAGAGFSTVPGRTGGFNAGIDEVGRLHARHSSTPASISGHLSRSEAITVSSRFTDTFSQTSSTNNGGTPPPYHVHASVARAQSPPSELSSHGTSHRSKPDLLRRILAPFSLPPRQVTNATASSTSTSGPAPHQAPPYQDEAHTRITPSLLRSPISPLVPEL